MAVVVSLQFDFLKRKAPMAAPVVRPTVTPDRQFNIPIALGGIDNGLTGGVLGSSIACTESFCCQHEVHRISVGAVSLHLQQHLVSRLQCMIMFFHSHCCPAPVPVKALSISLA